MTISPSAASQLDTYARQTAADCDCDRVTALNHMADGLNQVMEDTRLDSETITQWLMSQMLACLEAVDPRLAGWIGCFV